jgi:serine/threonine protein kinase
MSASESSSAILIRVAAEAMAPAIPGCANILAAGSRSNDQNGKRPPSLKGLNLFGPLIVEHWFTRLSRQEVADQVAELIALSRVVPAESRREAGAAVEEFAQEASEADKALAMEYLTAIPLSVRRSLILDRTTGRPTIHPELSTDNERSLYRMLPADVPPFPIGAMVPGTSYELQELIGIGGFGAVYKARNRFEQNQPPRAIKFCLDSSMLATLYRERAMLDRLMAVGHKNWSNRIVRLYGYALEVQPAFLVYEYVAGGDLTSHLTATRQKTGRGFRPRIALELVRQVAEALAFAHSQGMVHRDLKPANILVSGSTIKLTDFGIGGVVATHVARGGSGSGSISGAASAADQASVFRGSGTPLYMSAEQRRGENPDPRHDLFSLGVVWYQLLVGDVTRELHPGWPDELTEEFRTPREHIELIQRCVGYFKKRPANAGELLAQLPSPPPDAITPIALQTRNTPASNAPAREYERLKSLMTDQIEHEAWHCARETVNALLQWKVDDQGVLEAKSLVDGHLARLPQPEIACFREHTGWVRTVVMAADGRTALSGGDDETLRHWDLIERKCLTVFQGHTGAVMCAAMAKSGRRALSAGWDGSMRWWDLSTGKELRAFKAGKSLKCVALAPDGRHALCGGDDHEIRIWDLNRGTEIGRLKGHRDMVHALAVSPNGRLAVSGSDDKTVRTWDLASHRELKCCQGHSDTVTAVAFSPDGNWVASGSSDMTVRLWAVEDGGELCRLTAHRNWINALALTADGQRLLTASGGEIRNGQFEDGYDTSVRVWDTESGKELMCLLGHVASVTCIAATPDGRYAVSGSLDRTVRLWDLAAG